MEQHKRDLAIVVETGKRVHGIIGPNPFEKLEGFDHVEAYVPEYMHSCCLGVFKMFMNLWLAGKYKTNKWYIGHLKAVVNARLGQARPPYDISRTIDSIDDLTHWKASMYRTFALYYFHLLESILPQPYFEHFSSLVYGLFLLWQEKVSVDDVRKVERLFHQFVIDSETLYGIENIGINVHFLTHLPDCILKWGCLWATSAYIPEWFNGVLVSMCKGTRAITEQMNKSYLMNLAVREEVITLIKTENLPPTVELLFKDLLHLTDDSVRKFGKGKVVNNGTVKLMGSSSSRKLTMYEEAALLNKIKNLPEFTKFSDMDFSHCEFFARFQLISTSGSIFTRTAYSKSPKRINYFALLYDGSFFAIESIVYFNSVNLAFVIGKKYGSISKKTFLPSSPEDLEFTPIQGQTTRLIGKSAISCAFDPKEIKCKCVIAMNNELTDTYLITSLANHFETD